MPRTASKRAKTRLNIEVTHAVRERMNRLLDLSESETLTEVIRRSLAVYETLLQQRADGAETIVRTKDGQERVLMIS